jgi:hypothetical protein
MITSQLINGDMNDLKNVTTPDNYTAAGASQVCFYYFDSRPKQTRQKPVFSLFN